MCHLLKFDGLFHTKLFCFRVNHPRFFRTKQITIMNFRIFRHFSVQNLFPNVSSVSNIYFQNSSPPQKKTVLAKPTCYTKVPKLAPLVDVQRIPKFGYLSQTTSRGKPFVKRRGETTGTQLLGGPRIEENPALAAQCGSLVGWPMMGMIRARNGILEIRFSIFFLIFPKKQSDEFRKNTISPHFSILPCHKKYIYIYIYVSMFVVSFVFSAKPLVFSNLDGLKRCLGLG